MQTRNRKPGISGYKGVSKLTDIPNRAKPWQARLYFSKNNKTYTIYIGEFETPELAYIARLQFIDSLK